MPQDDTRRPTTVVTGALARTRAERRMRSVGTFGTSRARVRARGRRCSSWRTRGEQGRRGSGVEASVDDRLRGALGRGAGPRDSAKGSCWRSAGTMSTSTRQR
jgi:hypothetical protein